MNTKVQNLLVPWHLWRTGLGSTTSGVARKTGPGAKNEKSNRYCRARRSSRKSHSRTRTHGPRGKRRGAEQLGPGAATTTVRADTRCERDRTRRGERRRRRRRRRRRPRRNPQEKSLGGRACARKRGPTVVDRVRRARPRSVDGKTGVARARSPLGFPDGATESVDFPALGGFGGRLSRPRRAGRESRVPTAAEAAGQGVHYIIDCSPTTRNADVTQERRTYVRLAY